MKTRNWRCSNLVIFIFSFLIFDCHKDDVVQNSTITFTTMDSSNSYWVVLSDNSGTVLGWKALVPNTPASLMFPQKEDSVNVTIIEKYNPSSSPTYRMITYTNVVPGSYGVSIVSTPPVQNVNGGYSLSVPAPTNGHNLVVNSDCGWSANSDYSLYNINVCTISSLYVGMQLVGNSAPRYLYIPQITVGGSTVFDQAFINGLPVMKSNLITFSEPTDATSIVTGNTNTTDQSVLVSFFEPGYSGTTSTIYYPDKVGSLFKSLNVILLYSYSSSPYVGYYYGKQTQDVSTITVTDLPANLVTVSSETLTHLSYQLGGSAHYACALFAVPSSKNSSSTSAGTWIIYSRFGSTVDVKLPQLSSSLIKDIDFSFLDNLELNEILLIEDNDHGGYSNFYKGAILGSQSSNNLREKSYTVKPDGSIGGRKKNVSSRLTKYKKLLPH